jgi:plastocyanin
VIVTENRVMRTQLVWLSLPACLFLVTPALAAEKPGGIAGIVRYTGPMPEPEKILTTEGGTILHTDLVVDPKTRGLRHVMAVLENALAQPKVTKEKPVLMDQRDMVFLPRVVAVQHGQAVSFDNSDSCNHSVMASSTVPANQFNVFVLSGKPHEHVFEPQRHPVTIGCSLHAWMRAWVYVVPHPWFAVSDEQGKFQIKDIPPGKYTLWLRHPDTGRQERREVEVQAGKTLELTIEWRKVDKQ